MNAAAEVAAGRARSVILVLGAHRSGTSATTGLLGKLGARMPASVMSANEGNRKGYWESTALHDFHERLLSEAGSRWNDWTSLEIQSADDYAAELIAIIDAEYGHEGLCAIKDPRMCRMVPFWLRVLAMAGWAPHAVIPYRNPLEVAASLVRRGGGMTTAEAQAMWLRHVLDAESGTRGIPRVFVRYDRLVDDWRSVVAEIERGLTLTWPVAPSEAADDIDKFIDGQLRRQVVPDDARMAWHPWLRDTFAALDELAGEAAALAAHEELDRIAGEFERACEMFAPLARPMGKHDARSAGRVMVPSAAGR